MPGNFLQKKTNLKSLLFPILSLELNKILRVTSLAACCSFDTSESTINVQMDPPQRWQDNYSSRNSENTYFPNKFKLTQYFFGHHVHKILWEHLEKIAWLERGWHFTRFSIFNSMTKKLQPIIEKKAHKSLFPHNSCTL